MRAFIRKNSIPNIKGRVDYISNPKRQEHLLYVSEHIDWDPYIEYEHKHKRGGKHKDTFREAQEIIIALPNSWDCGYRDWILLPEEERAAHQEEWERDFAAKMKEVVKTKVKPLIVETLEKDTDFEFALHYNKDLTNFHAHVEFSERSIDPEKTEYYTRTQYRTDDGRIARKKSERAKDENGNELKPVYKKGQIKNIGFTTKNPMYGRPSFVRKARAKLEKLFEEELGVELEPKRPFRQLHHGKGNGPKAQAIKIENQARDHDNAWYEAYSNQMIEMDEKELADLKKEMEKNHHGDELVTRIFTIPDNREPKKRKLIYTVMSPEQSYELLESKKPSIFDYCEKLPEKPVDLPVPDDLLQKQIFRVEDEIETNLKHVNIVNFLTKLLKQLLDKLSNVRVFKECLKKCEEILIRIHNSKNRPLERIWLKVRMVFLEAKNRILNGQQAPEKENEKEEKNLNLEKELGFVS